MCKPKEDKCRKSRTSKTETKLGKMKNRQMDRKKIEWSKNRKTSVGYIFFFARLN